jgi:hypothetical protein
MHGVLTNAHHLLGKPSGKRSHDRCDHRSEVTIKMDLIYRVRRGILDSTTSGKFPLVGFCEHSIELSCFLKVRTF